MSVGADVYLEHLKEELKTVEAESSKISNEIEALTGTNIEGENSHSLFHMYHDLLHLVSIYVFMSFQILRDWRVILKS